MIPQNTQNQNDVFDFLADGMHERKERINEDGMLETFNEFNPKIAWYQSHIVNQPFGRMALHLEQLYNLSQTCHDYMYYDRADPIKRGLELILDAYKRSVDAKSSETYRDKDHIQSSMINLLSRNKTEQDIRFTGDKKNAGLAKMFGLGGNDDED